MTAAIEGGTAPWRRRRSAAFVAVTAAAAMAVSYAGTLAWDQEKYYGADGNLHGPYQDWQGAVLCAAVAAAAFLGGAAGRPVTATYSVALTVTVLWAVDAATDPPEVNDGLWPVGAMLVAFATSATSLLVAVAGDRCSRHRRALTPPRQQRE